MLGFTWIADISAGIIAIASIISYAYIPLLKRAFIKQSGYALAQAVESREPHLNSHALRTAQLAREMATRSMRVLPWRIWDLEMAALLHMIGKAGVPCSLLANEAEAKDWQIYEIREYVRIGVDIISEFPALKSAAKIISFHREYMDGGGYPLGRYGADIPFEARILCVATEYVAMTSPRIYHPNQESIDSDEALRYFVEQSGARYDPTVVNLLIKSRSSTAVKKSAKRIQLQKYS
jgi:HD-GYP domain-containing protein (c-di-GMP phosphodiesterase class II)